MLKFGQRPTEIADLTCGKSIGKSGTTIQTAEIRSHSSGSQSVYRETKFPFFDPGSELMVSLDTSAGSHRHPNPPSRGGSFWMEMRYALQGR